MAGSLSSKTVVSVENAGSGGVALRGGLQRRNEVSARSVGINTMEVRSVRIRKPARGSYMTERGHFDAL